MSTPEGQHLQFPRRLPAKRRAALARPPDNAKRPKSARKLSIGPSARRCRIRPPMQRIRLENMQDGSNQIVDRDPAHPLAPAAQPPSEPRPKNRQHLLQRPAFARKNDPKAKMHHPKASLRGTLGFCLPGAAGIEPESRVPVRNSRSGPHRPDPHKCRLLRRIASFGEGFAAFQKVYQRPGSSNTAFDNFPLIGIRPPARERGLRRTDEWQHPAFSRRVRSSNSSGASGFHRIDSGQSDFSRTSRIV